jgi:hypothetical protein
MMEDAVKHHRYLLRWVPVAALLIACTVNSSMAEAAELLESIEISTEAGCNQIHVRTTLPVIFGGKSLSGHDGKLNIPLETLAVQNIEKQDSEVPLNEFGLKTLRLKPVAPGKAILELQFATAVDHNLVMEAETRHIRIDVAGPKDALSCVLRKTVNPEESVATIPQDDFAGMPDDLLDQEKPAEVANVDVAPPAAPSDAVANLKLRDNASELKSDLPSTITLRSMGKVEESVENPAAWKWGKSGQLSQIAVATSDTLPGIRDGSASKRLHATSNFFAEFTGSNESHEVMAVADARVSGAWNNNKNIKGLKVNKLYGLWQDKTSGMKFTLGRQVKQDAGVMGRFDGLTLDWTLSPETHVGMLVGGPAYDTTRLPFADGRALYGTSLEFEPLNSAWKTQIYFIEQRLNAQVDRRAFGTNVSFDTDAFTSMFGIDYDLYQTAMTSAYWQGTWRMNDRLSFSSNLEYVTQPLLLSSNAFIGRAETNFPELLDQFNESGLKQLAADRTARAVSGAVELTYDFANDWQLALDMNWNNVSGTPASGGVAAEASLGSEMAIGLHAYGQDVFRTDDSVALGVATRTNNTLNELTFDEQWRFPFSERLSMAARLKTGLRVRDGGAMSWFAAPDISADYRFSDTLSGNAEFGLSYDNGASPGSRFEFIGLIGISQSF